MNLTREYVLTRLTAEERKAMCKRLLAHSKVRMAISFFAGMLSLIYLAWRMEYGWEFFDGMLVGTVIGVLYLLAIYTVGDYLLWRPPTQKEIETHKGMIR